MSLSTAAHSVLNDGPLKPGDHFLKFEVKGLLGKGGHAWVYHGYDAFLDRHVAIKVIPKPAEPGRDLARRAQLEARVLCRLQHPNVVHVIDAGATIEGAVYIIMEVLHGRTLRDVIHALCPLGVREVLWLGAEIADGVQAAHEQHAIHRDLKPENVFILQDNAVKVLDFGIAKFLGYGAAVTQKDLLHGTILYMSPEHLQGFGVTARSDIYALGTILYEAFVGVPPCMIGSPDPTVHAIAWSQLNRMPPPLDELTGTVPGFVARAIQRMVAKEPADRFASMAEVSAVLRAHARRYEQEFSGALAAPRELWHGTAASIAAHSVSPPTPVRTLTDDISANFGFAQPTFKGPNGQSGDTAPLAPHAVSRPPAPASQPPAEARARVQTAATLLAIPVSQAAPAAVEVTSAASSPERKAVGRRRFALQLLAGAVGLGATISLFFSASRVYRRQPERASAASPHEPVASPLASSSASNPPTLPVVATPERAQAEGSAVATGLVATKPLVAAAAPTAVAHAEQARVSPEPNKATPKPPAAPPKSGLWDMSDLDAPTKAKPVPPAGTVTAKKPVVGVDSPPDKPRPKLIYGADDIR
jgi:eukaryotic-like serine/threonine-protein kinase